MTVSAHTPGIPKNPEIVAVIKLIGTWIPKLLPNALRKIIIKHQSIFL